MKQKLEIPNFNPLLKGKVTIELKDKDTGRIVQKVNTHNFIAKNIFALMEAYVRAFITNGIIESIGPIGRTRNFEGGSPFGRLILTTASHPEDPQNEWLPKGRIIGYALANETYSGSDTLRGTINTQESWGSLKQVHLVFDFPTHAANGTFQSLYFAPVSNWHFPTGQENYYIFGGYSPIYIKKQGDKYYCHHLTTNYKNYIDVFNEKERGYYNIDGTPKTAQYERRNVSHEFMSFEIVGNRIYTLNYADTLIIRSANLNSDWNDSNSWTTELNVSNSNFQNINRARTIAYDTDRQRWYILDDNDKVFVLDNNFNILKIFQVPQPKDYVHGYLSVNYPLIYDKQQKVLINREAVIDVDTETSHTLSMQTGSTSRYFRIIGVDDDYMYWDQNGRTSMERKMYIGSRVLLDSPITKTSNNTMKITYDLIFSDFAIPGLLGMPFE